MVGAIEPVYSPIRSVILRATQVFKIGVKLHTSDSKNILKTANTQSKAEPAPMQLSEEDKAIIAATQGDLSLTHQPFEQAAHALGMTQTHLLGQLERFKQHRVMRRFAAILFHRNVGFKANCMAVWEIPKPQLKEIGTKVAGFQAVSHCYERTANNPDWLYNFFAMLHAKDQSEMQEIIQAIRNETDLPEPCWLRTTQEFKKIRLRYFTKDFSEWAKRYIKIP